MAWWVPLATVGAQIAADKMFGEDPPAPPQYAPRDVQMPDREAYLNSLLDSGFNNQGELYQQAAEMVTQQVNRVMSQNGMVGSSLHTQALNSALSDLGNKFVQDAVNRKSKALSPVLRYDAQRAGVDAGLAETAYNAQMNQWQHGMNMDNANMANIQGLIQGGMQAYGNYSAGQQAAADRQANRDLMREIYLGNNRSYPAPDPNQGTGYLGVNTNFGK